MLLSIYIVFNSWGYNSYNFTKQCEHVFAYCFISDRSKINKKNKIEAKDGFTSEGGRSYERKQ